MFVIAYNYWISLIKPAVIHSKFVEQESGLTQSQDDCTHFRSLQRVTITLVIHAASSMFDENIDAKVVLSAIDPYTCVKAVKQ